MKKLIWPAAILLAFALLFPNGIQFKLPTPAPTPAPAPAPSPAPAPTPAPVVKDAKIAELLANAPAEDKNRVRGMYLGMSDVIARDGGKLRLEDHGRTIRSARHLRGSHNTVGNVVAGVIGLHDKGQIAGIDRRLDPAQMGRDQPSVHIIGRPVRRAAQTQRRFPCQNIGIAGIAFVPDHVEARQGRLFGTVQNPVEIGIKAAVFDDRQRIEFVIDPGDADGIHHAPGVQDDLDLGIDEHMGMRQGRQGSEGSYHRRNSRASSFHRSSVIPCGRAAG